mgnify:CR=1 FL=1
MSQVQILPPRIRVERHDAAERAGSIAEKEVIMSMPGPMEIVVILLVVLLLFGAKRLPEIGRALGEGIREFKKSIKGGDDDDNSKQIKP